MIVDYLRLTYLNEGISRRGYLYKLAYNTSRKHEWPDLPLITALRSGCLCPIPPGIESLPLRQRFQPARRTTRLTPFVRLIIAPPRDLDRSPLHTKQHNDTRNGDTRAKCRRKNKVVLGPEGQVPLAHVDPAEPRDGHGGKRVREGVRSKVDAAVEHGHGVQLSYEAGEAPVLDVLDHQPNGDGGADANGEAEEGRCVLAVYAEDLEGADCAPEDGGCEEGVWAGAEEAHGWVCWGADVGDVYLPVLYVKYRGYIHICWVVN
jgi:hypothetical protein